MYFIYLLRFDVDQNIKVSSSTKLKSVQTRFSRDTSLCSHFAIICIFLVKTFLQRNALFEKERERERERERREARGRGERQRERKATWKVAIFGSGCIFSDLHFFARQTFIRVQGQKFRSALISNFHRALQRKRFEKAFLLPPKWQTKKNSPGPKLWSWTMSSTTTTTTTSSTTTTTTTSSTSATFTTGHKRQNSFYDVMQNARAGSCPRILTPELRIEVQSWPRPRKSFQGSLVKTFGTRSLSF